MKLPSPKELRGVHTKNFFNLVLMHDGWRYLGRYILACFMIGHHIPKPIMIYEVITGNMGGYMYYG